MIARIVRSADFEHVLRTRKHSSSPHFAVHHVVEAPWRAKKAEQTLGGPDLSMEQLAAAKSIPAVPPPTFSVNVWLGCVVPKRYARRSVTRNLLKRQMRAAVAAHAAVLSGGFWVVRLRASFDRTQYVSAASDELRRSAREELDGLIAGAAARGLRSSA